MPNNDEQSDAAIGFGIACLVLAAIAFFWTQFRASAPMVWLARRPTFNALAIVGGGVLAGFLAGVGLMADDGLARALGAFLVLLALGLGAAALIARHSLRVEQGSGQPLFSRERLPRWIALGVAVVLALLFVGGFGQSLSGDPEAPAISEDTRRLAEAAENDPAEPLTQALKQAQALAEPAVAKAEKLDDALQEAQDAKNEAGSMLAAARGRLNQAQRTARQASARLAAQAAAAEAAAERAAARAARQAEQEAQQALNAPSAPSYSSCATAPSNIPVSPGSDLDADGDGIGCES